MGLCPGCRSNITTYGFDYVPGDFNNDTFVNIADFGALAWRWLETDCCTCGGVDLTGEQNVNIEDLRELAELWLSIPSME